MRGIGRSLQIGIWRGNRCGSTAVVFGAKAESDQRQRINFAVIGQLLIGLEAFQSVNRIVVPLAVDLSFEIAAVGKRLLNLLVPLRIRMQLVGRRGRDMGPGVSRPSLAGVCVALRQRD